MNENFTESVKKARKVCGFNSPVVSFSSGLREKIIDQDKVEYLEGMLTLLECHPMLASMSLKNDTLDYRKYLAYEIILRQIGHTRSLVANSNCFNHIGTAVALRCMIELYAFTSYLVETDTLKDEVSLDKLLHGGVFSSGDWLPIKKVWPNKNNGNIPKKAKNRIKDLLETTNVSTYLQHTKAKDEGFDQLYAHYSNYIHPTFSYPREQLLEDVGDERDPQEVLADNEYYKIMQQDKSPSMSIERDIKAGCVCLEIFWPQILEIDPNFSKELGINTFG